MSTQKTAPPARSLTPALRTAPAAKCNLEESAASAGNWVETNILTAYLRTRTAPRSKSMKIIESICGATIRLAYAKIIARLNPIGATLLTGCTTDPTSYQRATVAANFLRITFSTPQCTRCHISVSQTTRRRSYAMPSSWQRTRGVRAPGFDGEGKWIWRIC